MEGKERNDTSDDTAATTDLNTETGMDRIRSLFTIRYTHVDVWQHIPRTNSEMFSIVCGKFFRTPYSGGRLQGIRIWKEEIKGRKVGEFGRCFLCGFYGSGRVASYCSSEFGDILECVRMSFGHSLFL